MFRSGLVPWGQKPSEQAVQLVHTGYFCYFGRGLRRPPKPDRREPCYDFMRYWQTTQKDPVPTDYIHAAGDTTAELQGLMKYAKPQYPLDSYGINFARHMLDRELAMLGTCGILSQDDAWTECEKTTSPGYPWSMLGSTKNDVWKVKDFPVLMDEFFQSLEKTPLWTPIWTSSIKVEMRPLEKVLDDKLRGFVASPLELTLAFIRVFGQFNSRFYELGRRHRIWSRIGMTKYYRGWDRLARSVFGKGCTGDVSQMDSSILQRFFDVIYAFKSRHICGGKMQHVIKKLHWYVVYSVIIMTSGDIIQKETGNPSGSGNTSVDNTLTLMMLIYYAFGVLSQEHLPSASLSEKANILIENVYPMLYGDDNTMFVMDRIIDWFNMKACANIWLEIGFKITVEHGWEHDLIDTQSFLSHRFLWNTQHKCYVPQADDKKLLASLMFGSRNQDPRWSVLRASAILCEGYWNERVRGIVRGFIEYIFEVYRDRLLEGEVAYGISWSDIRGMLRTDRQIELLYIGQYECYGDDGFPMDLVRRAIPDLCC